MKRFLPHIGCFVILLLFAGIYYGELLARLPFGIHEWAQADRLSLAINFYDNGLNFFKPATHALLSREGIVGVEFPIQSYIAACLGYLFGRETVSACFRIEGILLSCSGLYFLFRIAYDRSKDFLLSMLPPVLIFCSPVFAFYTACYLPDPAAVSITFIAFFYFLRYADSGRLRTLMACVILLTLSVLIKATTVSYWAGIAAYALYQEVFRRKAPGRAAIVFSAFLLSGIVVLTQLWYIKYLNKTYDAFLFLSKTEPFSSWDAFNSFAENQFKDGMMQEYFLLVEYPVIIFIIALGLRTIFKQRRYRQYLLPLAFALPVVLIMFYLFGAQFPIHDYYVLAIFFPLIAYALAVSIAGIHQSFSKEALGHLRLGLSVTMLFLFFMSDHQNYQRFHLEGHYNWQLSYTNWVGGAALADSAHMPRKQYLLVCSDSPPNLSLVYFDRRGHVVPPEEFNDDMNVAIRILKESGWEYLALKAGTYRHIQETDSIKLKGFRMLAQNDHSVILKLMPGTP